jgi:hypothetical protein
MKSSRSLRQKSQRQACIRIAIEKNEDGPRKSCGKPEARKKPKVSLKRAKGKGKPKECHRKAIGKPQETQKIARGNS